MVTNWKTLFGGLFLLYILQFISGDGHVNIQVQVLQYDNPSGTSFHGTDYKSQRKCCDKNMNETVCSRTDTCDSYFIICIGGIGNGHCNGPSATTRVLTNMNSFTTSHDNTIIHSFVWNHWRPSNMEYIFNVMDKDGARAQELVDNFSSTSALRADMNYEESTTQLMSFQNFVSLDIGLRIWCQDGYTGPTCSKQCTTKPYSNCLMNQRPSLLPSCSDTDVLTLPKLSESTLPVDFTPQHLQQLLSHFISQDICPDATKINVTILHFTFTGSTEFKATCNDTAVSNLQFTAHIYILSLTNKAGLLQFFPNIHWTTPAFAQKSLAGAHVLMVLNVIEYKDTSSTCRSHGCSVDISVCLHTNRQGSCDREVRMQSTIRGTQMTICGGHQVGSTSASQGFYLIGLTAIPVIGVSVMYNDKQQWNVQNQTIQSYTPVTTYKDAQTIEMTLSSGQGQTLVLELMLWCATGWSGNHCEHDCKSTTYQICDKKGHHICKNGFHGSGCVDINECSNTNACKNGGTCQNTQGSFTCRCPTGWAGPTCNLDVDECGLGYCVNASSCTNSPGNFHCRCNRGYRGRTCTDTNECSLPMQLCKNGGTCSNSYGSYTCTCANGFTGDMCENDIDECALSICNSNGSISCNNTVGSYNCTCRSGWIGETCDTDVDECKGNPCLQGTCKNTPGNYTCTCSAGYAGRHCDKDYNECVRNPCGNNGTCINLPFPQRFRCNCVDGWDPKSRCHHHTDACGKLHPCAHGSCANKFENYSCSCDNGWSGKNCNIKIDECTKHPCKNNGICIHINGGYKCNCQNGWTGSNCSLDINECNNNSICLHGGQCKNTPGSYNCDCPKHWQGHHCENDVNECETIPCKHNGTCNNTQGSFTCTCPHNWIGSTCESDINECNFSPCKHTGTCNNTPGSYTCLCPQGWTSKHCETDTNECNTSPCNHHGTCLNTQGSYTCTCPLNWTGNHCENDVNECKYSPCTNNGTCKNTEGSYTCTCPQGWTGNHCENDTNECNTSPCNHHGSCLNTQGSYTCTCPLNWTGNHCENDINECESSPCTNNGTCSNTQGSYICTCPHNWTGSTCESDINECNTFPCKNNGSCDNTQGSYTCTCSPQWFGTHCETDKNECNISTCKHNGTCNNTQGSFTCTCPHNWTGSTCESDINECDSAPCKHKGTCDNKPGNYTCLCSPAWTGSNCETDVNECTSSPCKNNGNCSNIHGSFACTCPSHLTGNQCEADIDECKSFPCENKGTCNNNRGNYTCTCPPEWTGNHCETDTNECNSSPCKNHGTCNNAEGAYKCFCPYNWTGNHCEIDVNECNSSPCKHHGTCNNTHGSYICFCPNYWTGEHCETDVNECDSRPCKNDGTCNNNPGSFACTCPPNWTGARCEADIDECKSSPCKHSGSCLNTQGNYSCICPLSWMGKQCETDLDECQSSPCINNGICENYLGSFRCNCTKGWKGNNCELDVDECKGSITPCGKGALCSNTNGSYVCKHDYTTASVPVMTRSSQTKAYESTLQKHASVTTDNAVKNDHLTTSQSNTYMNTETPPYTSSTGLKQISISERNILYNSSTHPVHANASFSTKTSSTKMSTMPHTYTNMTSSMHLSATTGISAETTSQPTTSTATIVKYTPMITSITNASYVTSVGYSKNGEHKNVSEFVSVAVTDSASSSTISARHSTKTDELHTTPHYGTTSTPNKTTAALTAAKSSTTLNSKFSRIRPTSPSSTATTVKPRSSTTTAIYVRLEDAIHPRCTNSGWNITINMSILKQLYPGITSNHIYFGDSTCRGTEIGNHLIFQQGFGDCLTSERISGGAISYENDLYYAIYDPINPFIIRQHKWTYTVECDVSSKEATSSHVHHDIDAHHTAVSGHYNISMTFFKDTDYMQQLSGNPIHASVGDNVYVKVFTTASDWSIKMRLHTCYTKPTDAANDMTFYIIKDGCEVDSNTHIISQSTHETRFVFQDFEYSTNREGLNIYCNATFCETQDYSPGCAQSCISHGTQAIIGK